MKVLYGLAVGAVIVWFFSTLPLSYGLLGCFAVGFGIPAALCVRDWWLGKGGW